MTEWLKNIYTSVSPISYGLKQINFIITNAIQIFLNAYGDKILKINDLIIEKNECTENKNSFFLYPIIINESTAYLGLNLINIQSGEIYGMIINVPSIGSNNNDTTITIKQINLSLEIIQVTENDFLMSTVTEKSFSENNNKNILNVYNEIKDFLTQYFNNILCKIDMIIIKLTNNDLLIKLTDITFKNNTCICTCITINEIIMNNIKFIGNEGKMLIDSVRINSNIIKNIPELYLENKQDANFKFVLSVKNLIIDEFGIDDIEIIFTDKITISKLKSISINERMIYSDLNSEITIFEKSGTAFLFHKQIIFNVYDIEHVTGLINETFLALINDISNKIIIIDESEMIDFTELQRNNSIKNIDFIINEIKQEITFKITIGNVILIPNNITLNSIKIIHNEVTFICDQITRSKTETVLNNVSCLNRSFTMHAKKIQINNDDNICNIFFYDANVIDIGSFITWINTIINTYNVLFPKPLKTNTLIKIHINSSTIIHFVSTIECKFIINKANINITEKVAENIILSVLLDNYLVANISATKISPINNEIEIIRIYFDPELFDKMNFILGILDDITTDTDNQNESYSHSMSQTIASSTMDDFESSVQQMLNELDNNNNGLQSLLKSLDTLNDIIIDNYVPTDNNENLIYTINIASIYIYLYDELDTYKDNNTTDKMHAFLLIMFKKIDIVKYMNNVDDVTYDIHLHSCIGVDMKCNNPKNRYFLMNTYEKDFTTMTMIINISGNLERTLKIQIDVRPLSLNINEETLIRILSFFSNSYKIPTNNEDIKIKIKNFTMKKIILTINYYPVIPKYIDYDILSLQDYKLILESHNINNINGFNDLYQQIINIWKPAFNIDMANIIKFIPNIKMIQPLTTQISDLMYFVNKYFSNSHNKKALRNIIKMMSQKTSFTSFLFNKGINRILELADQMLMI
jgi:hypothetical protein